MAALGGRQRAGRMLGLGAKLDAGVLFFARLGDPQSLAAALRMILLMTASGAIVGAAHGAVLVRLKRADIS